MCCHVVYSVVTNIVCKPRLTFTDNNDVLKITICIKYVEAPTELQSPHKYTSRFTSSAFLTNRNFIMFFLINEFCNFRREEFFLWVFHFSIHNEWKYWLLRKMLFTDHMIIKQYFFTCKRITSICIKPIFYFLTWNIWLCLILFLIIVV